MKSILYNYICILLFLFFISPFLNGQIIERQVVGVGGGSLDSGNGYTSFTIGEPIIGTLISENRVLTQGFQQNEILGPNDVTDLEIAPIDIYPNPVMDKLFLRNSKRITYDEIRIVNVNGEIVSREFSPINEISVSGWKEGIYFLGIVKADKIEYLPFKFVKIGY